MCLATMFNKILATVILTCYAIGLVILSLTLVFRDSFSDFAKGFNEGVSLVFILVGFIYICRCTVLKKNPYKN